MRQESMKALIWEGPGKLILAQVPIPEPQYGEVLLRVAYTGLCSTDREIFEGRFPYPPPYIPGHEISGTVVEKGAGVADLSESDLMVVDPALPCRQCVFCKSGTPQFCQTYRELGITENGGWAEYVKVPAVNLHRINKKISPMEAALFEPLACPYGAVESAGLLPGEHVLIMGDGPAGLYFVQIARMLGAGEITLIYKHENLAAIAKKLGATTLMHMTDSENLSQTFPVANQGGFDLVIDAVGSSRTTTSAVGWARNGGKLIMYGFRDAETSGFPHRDVILKNLTLFGRTNSPFVWSRAIVCVERDLLRLDHLNIRVISPSEAADVLSETDSVGQKTVIRWHGDAE